MTAGFAVLLILAAGTANIPMIWVVLAVQFIFGLIATAVLDESLLEERLHPPKDQDEDPAGKYVITVIYIAAFVVAALDVGRLHWTDRVPFVLQLAALIPLVLGWAGFFWAIWTNNFFALAIRIQSDRGQYVISSGPYAIIRHPGYSFGSLAFLFQGIAMGSWLSVIPSVLVIVYLMHRTVLEEQLLSANLPGYDDYKQKVRFRWLPGVW